MCADGGLIFYFNRSSTTSICALCHQDAGFPKYLVIRWVYLETIPGGQPIDVNETSSLYLLRTEDNNVLPTDFLDSYMSKVDAIMFGYLLNKGCEMVVKCCESADVAIHSQDYVRQACILCIKCPSHPSYNDITSTMESSNYEYITLDSFPWAHSQELSAC